QNLNVLLLKLRGQDVNPIADQNTLLTDLNAGAGVSFQGDTGNDLEIDAGDGTAIKVKLGGATTVNDVITAINAAAMANNPAAPKVAASLATMGRVILKDNTHDPKGNDKFPFTSASLDASTAAADLGIDEAPIKAPIDFNFDLGGLASLKTNSNVFLQADVNA